MKKLLGVTICMCAGIALTMGSTGCTTKPKTTTPLPKTTTTTSPDTTKTSPPTTVPSTTPDKSTSPTPKSPTTTPDKKAEITIAEQKAIKLKQGEKKELKIAVTLKDVKEAKLSIAVKADKDGGKGLTAVVAPATLDKSGDAMVTVTAADDAVLGDYWITLTAASTAEGGPSASSKFMATVEKK